MDDLISRQDAIDLIKKWSGGYEYIETETESAIKELCEMPSAQPERKTGKWIKTPEFCGDDVSGFIDNHFMCSECKKEAEINIWGFYILSEFCPHCGARMA